MKSFLHFLRKPIFSIIRVIYSFGGSSDRSGSWAHHMFATGMTFTEKTVFMVGTLAAVPPSAMHVFNFMATMWGGRIKFAAPMLFGVGGIVSLFYASGAGGVVNTAIPLDFVTHVYSLLGCWPFPSHIDGNYILDIHWNGLLLVPADHWLELIIAANNTLFCLQWLEYVSCLESCTL